MPVAPKRPCTMPGCPALVDKGTTRCPAHQAEYQRQRDQGRGKTAQRGYGSKWQRHSEKLTKQVGFCQICGHPGSPDNPLTCNHDVPVSKGGGIEDANTVLCRRCNSRLGNR